MHARRTTARRRATALVGASGLLTAAGIAGLSATPAMASSHREAPLISTVPQLDGTDVYAFKSPDAPSTVTLIADYYPEQSPAGGPNFYRFARNSAYDINIDNNGDAKPDIIYRYEFRDSYQNTKTFLYNTGVVTGLSDPDLNFRQSFDLTRIEGGKSTALISRGKVVPSDVGKVSMPNYGALRAEGISAIPGGGKTVLTQADDPFFVDLRVFDLLYGTKLQEVGNDSLAGKNVNSIVLQVPIAKVTKGDPVIGVWSTASRKNSAGAWVQQSRLGNPLVNEVVVPVGAKDLFNASKPQNDAQFLPGVTMPELPKLIQAIYGIKAPAEPRNDLVSVFLTGVKGLNQPKTITPSEELRLNTSTPVTRSPKRLGVLDGDLDGFPNGRRLTDDVIDIALQVTEGELVGAPNDLGDGVNASDKAVSKVFPYVALPHDGSETPAPVKAGTASLLNGGAVSSSTPSNGVPVLPASLIGMAALALLGGAALTRSRHRGSRLATV